jgi:hypothetical protein
MNIQNRVVIAHIDDDRAARCCLDRVGVLLYGHLGGSARFLFSGKAYAPDAALAQNLRRQPASKSLQDPPPTRSCCSNQTERMCDRKA